MHTMDWVDSSHRDMIVCIETQDEPPLIMSAAT
jgi:hypothetical protein